MSFLVKSTPFRGVSLKSPLLHPQRSQTKCLINGRIIFSKPNPHTPRFSSFSTSTPTPIFKSLYGYRPPLGHDTKKSPPIITYTELPTPDFKDISPFDISKFKVKIEYTSDLIKANQLLSQLKGPYLGFNVRWPPSDEEWSALARNGLVNSTEKKKTLLEFCDENMVVIVEVDGELPTMAVEILGDLNTFKIGNMGRERHYYKLIQRFPKQFPTNRQIGPGIKSVRLTSAIDIPIFHPEIKGLVVADPNPSYPHLIDLTDECRPIGGIHPIRKLSTRTFNKILPRIRWDTWRGFSKEDEIKDLASDVYVYFLLFKDARLYAAKNGIQLNPERDARKYWLPVRVTKLESSKETRMNLLKKSPRGEDNVFRPGVLSERFFSEFHEGKDIKDIANDIGIPYRDVELWICQVADTGAYPYLNGKHRQRLWDQVGHNKDSETWRKCERTYWVLWTEYSGEVNL